MKQKIDSHETILISLQNKIKTFHKLRCSLEIDFFVGNFFQMSIS